MKNLAALREAASGGAAQGWWCTAPSALAAVLMALALPALPNEASAACAPPAGNNVTATCTGATNNQNGTNGYGTGAETGLTVSVVNGASVVGTNNGIAASTVTVTNAGTITGTVIAGLNVGSTTVTNAGTISGGSFGIFATGSATVTNSGTILGRAVNGISAITFATVNNSGTISGGVLGISGANMATVTNSGTVSGGQFGIVSGGTALVTNSGTILGTGTGSFEIQGGNAIVVNSGLISASTGISSAAAAANVINSGTIIGTGGIALQFSAAADTLTILPGSKIIGAINLGGGGDTVNFRTGNQNLTFDTLARATVTSNVPFVVSGNRAVTIDPTSLAASDRIVVDFTREISGLVSGRLNEAAANRGSGVSAFAPSALGPADQFAGSAFGSFDPIPALGYAPSDAVVFKNPTMTRPDGSAVWAKGFYGQVTQDAQGPLLRTQTSLYGGAIGFDTLLRPDLRLGVVIGGGATNKSIDLNMGGADSNIVFGGAYGRYNLGAAFFDASLLVGGSHNSATRNNINNNLAPGGTRDRHRELRRLVRQPGNRLRLPHSARWRLVDYAGRTAALRRRRIWRLHRDRIDRRSYGRESRDAERRGARRPHADGHHH